MGESVIPQGDIQLLFKMVQILIENQAVEAEEKKAKRVAQEARNVQYQKISEYNEKTELNKQRLCTHLKNQPSKLYRSAPSIRTDYAVSHHTFPDGNTYIRCLICGAKWHRGDTPELWEKNGKMVENPTGIGWRQAIKMVAESTNTSTASETVMRQGDIIGSPMAKQPASPAAVKLDS